MISDTSLNSRAAGSTCHLSLITRQAVAARCGAVLAAACVALLASGCTNLGYYWQSVNGQLDIWQRERPVQEVIADPATLQATRQ